MAQFEWDKSRLRKTHRRLARDQGSALEELARPVESAHVKGRITLNEGAPLGLVSANLVAVDRVLRWAVRSVESGEPIADLWGRARPVPYDGGLVFAGVEGGSWRVMAEESRRLYDALSSRPVAFVGGVILVLGFLSLEPHIEFGDDPPAQPVVIQVIVEDQAVQVGVPLLVPIEDLR